MTNNTTDVPQRVPGRDDDADVPGKRMSDTLRKRREQTWQMLVIEDKRYTDVVASLAREYDVTEHAIEKDIQRMDDWLPKLNAGSTKSGVSRLKELRHNRKRRRELLEEIRSDPEADRAEELRILNQIDKAIAMDVDISQSLGLTDREPQEHVTKHEGAVEHELSDQQRQHLDQLQDWARGQVPERDDAIEVENLAEDNNTHPDDEPETEDAPDAED